MSNVRRGYIYLACLASLEVVAWAVISLLRNLLVPAKYTSIESTAFQIAVIVVGLPIFLVHWLWGQRLAEREPEERGAVLRRFYLYGIMASLIGPFVASAFDLLDTLMRLAFGLQAHGSYRYLSYSSASIIIYHLVVLVIMALLWLYHWRVVVADSEAIPETDHAMTVRRLYILGFSAVGLTMTALAAISLLRWLIFQFGGSVVTASLTGLTREVARLVVGLTLWLVFWNWAQRLFTGLDAEERDSALRKFYLYLTVFISVLTTVTAAAFVLAGVFRRLLDLVPRGGNGDAREALSVIVGAVLVWAYHAYVLRRDANLTEEQPGQAWIRQLYRYLVAAVGLGAFLVGLSGIISILLRYLSEVRFISGVPEETAWFSAVLIAGLPVWILPWRQAQIAALALGPTGDEESRSLVRRIYLYFYLFVATMTVLSSGIYIVHRLVRLALGDPGPGHLLADLGQTIAFSLIAVSVWLYHGSILRVDGRRAWEEQARRLASLQITVVNTEDSSFWTLAIFKSGIG